MSCASSKSGTFRLVSFAKSAGCLAAVWWLLLNIAFGNRGTKQERAAERDEQWEAQQHILKRRRGNLWQDVGILLHKPAAIQA